MIFSLIVVYLLFINSLKGSTVSCSSSNVCDYITLSCDGCDSEYIIECGGFCTETQINVTNIDSLKIISNANYGFPELTLIASNITSIEITTSFIGSFIRAVFNIDNSDTIIFSSTAGRKNFEDPNIFIRNSNSVRMLIDGSSEAFKDSIIVFDEVKNIRLNCSDSDECFVSSALDLNNIVSFNLLLNGEDSFLNGIVNGSNADVNIASNFQINCSGTNACSSSKLNCPVNNIGTSDCDIYCTGSSSCDNAVVNVKDQNRNIYCSGNGACKNMIINSIYVLSLESLFCATDSLQCNGTVINCGSEYSSSCIMSNIGTLSCNGDFCWSLTYSPTTVTQSPVASPSVLTTNPTITPSFLPSLSPTVNPTINPVIQPTINPSSVTKYPSSAPSFGPSIHPTSFPTLTPSVFPCRDKGMESSQQYNCASKYDRFPDIVCSNRYYPLCYSSCGYCDAQGEFCAEFDTYTLSTTQSYAEGGTSVQVTSNCFTSKYQKIYCLFGVYEIKGTYIGNATIQCISPEFTRRSKTGVGRWIFKVKMGDITFSKRSNFYYIGYGLTNSENPVNGLTLVGIYNIAQQKSNTTLMWSPLLFGNESEIYLFQTVYSNQLANTKTTQYGPYENTGRMRVPMPLASVESTMPNVQYRIEAASTVTARRLQTTFDQKNPSDWWGTQIDCDATTGVDIQDECQCQYADRNLDARGAGRVCENLKYDETEDDYIGTLTLEYISDNMSDKSDDELKAFYFCSLGCLLSVGTDLFGDDEKEVFPATSYYCATQSVTDETENCKQQAVLAANLEQGETLGAQVLAENLGTDESRTPCLASCEEALADGDRLAISYEDLTTTTSCSLAPTLYPTKSPVNSANVINSGTIVDRLTPTCASPQILPPVTCPTTQCPSTAPTTTGCLCLAPVPTPTPVTHDYLENCACTEQNALGTIGSASGDPHYTTVDGLYYHFQGQGVYTIIWIEEYQFEAQTINYRCSKRATCQAGIAFRSPFNDDIAVYRSNLWINGIAQRFTSTLIENYVDIIVTGKRFTFKFFFGLQVRWSGRSIRITYSRNLRGKTAGLYGTFDGNKANEGTARNGQVYTIRAGKTINNGFTSSWRRTGSNIIFPITFSRRLANSIEYTLQTSRRLITIAFNDSYETPNETVSLDDFPQATQDEVIAFCDNSTSCMLDLLLTNDTELANETKVAEEQAEEAQNLIDLQILEPVCIPTCINNATCVSLNSTTTNDTQAICVCLENYYGSYCQFRNVTTTLFPSLSPVVTKTPSGIPTSLQINTTFLPTPITTESDKNNENNSSNGAIIAGIVSGCCLVCFIVIGCLYYKYTQKDEAVLRKKSSVPLDHERSYSKEGVQMTNKTV